MLQIFRKSGIVPFVILVVMIVAYWVPDWAMNVGVASSQKSALYHHLSRWWVDTIYLKYIIGFILAILTVIVVNEFTVNRWFKNEKGMYVGWMYVLLLGCLYGVAVPSPEWLFGLVELLALGTLFRLYNARNDVSPIFLASLYLGFGTLIYPNGIIMLLFLFIAVQQLSILTLRKIIVICIGYFLPIYLLIGLRFVLAKEWPTIYYLPKIGFPTLPSAMLMTDWLGLGVITLLLLLVLLYNRIIRMKQNIVYQKYISTIYAMMITSFGVLIFEGKLEFHKFLIILPPMAILLGLLVRRVKGWQISVILLLVWFAGLLIHYFSWLP